MKKAKIIVMWALSVFMILVSLTYFPSATSIIAIVFAVIAAPIKKWQEILSGIGLRGWIKGVVLCAAFVVAVAIAPAGKVGRQIDQPSPEPSYHGTLPSKAPGKEATQKPEKTQEPTNDPGKTAAPDPTEKPTAPPTERPSQTPDETQAPKNAPDPQPIRGRSPDTIVYVSNRSDTVHSVHDCSGMRNYREMTIYDATQRGYEFCPNCW